MVARQLLAARKHAGIRRNRTPADVEEGPQLRAASAMWTVQEAAELVPAASGRGKAAAAGGGAAVAGTGGVGEKKKARGLCATPRAGICLVQIDIRPV